VSSAPVLIFTWGNPSRGDDALGPLCHDKLLEYKLDQVEILTDFQLQIEHCTDLENRERVLFVDASMSASEPFDLKPIEAAKDQSYSSHAVSPQSLMEICRQVNTSCMPECWLMEIRGYHFSLGQSLSPRASENLDRALTEILEFLQNKNPKYTKKRIRNY
jgi:hydrogenase maturation protease